MQSHDEKIAFLRDHVRLSIERSHAIMKHVQYMVDTVLTDDSVEVVKSEFSGPSDMDNTHYYLTKPKAEGMHNQQT